MNQNKPAVVKKLQERFRNVSVGRGLYIAFVMPTMLSMFSTRAFAADTIWTKASAIMQDVYTQILSISTIAAVVTAAVALLLMNFSRSGRTVDESRAWLKRIIITWAILNISNGKSYVEIIGNNQMITTAYIDRAHTFNNKKTAEKYCSLLPKAMKNLKYKVIFISNPNPENPDLQLELLTPEFYLTRLKNFSDFIHTIQCQRETLVTGQRKAELEIEDIEHAAEFYNLDASHGYQLYKLLHDARVRRRKCKNAIAWIDFILEQRPERFVENDPSARIAGTRSRDYAPRALPELFEWENEGQTSITVS